MDIFQGTGMGMIRKEAMEAMEQDREVEERALVRSSRFWNLDKMSHLVHLW